MKTVHDTFADTSDEEVARAVGPVSLNTIYEKLLRGSQLSGEDYGNLARMMQLMVRLFDTDLPALTEDIQTELSKSSQEINLGRFLREKSIVRIYMLTRQYDEDNRPLYMSVAHPDTGEFFGTQEEFIGWWCSAASVSRALIFQRLATYGRLEDLGFTLERSYEIMRARPSVITESLRAIATWEKTTLADMSPTVMKNLITEYGDTVEPEYKEKLEEFVAKGKDALSTREHMGLMRGIKPLVRELVEDAAFVFDSASDAIKEVKYGVSGKPEIRFSWDLDTNALVATMTQTFIGENGERTVGPEEQVHFLPDSYNNLVPREIIEKMENKLSIKNKGELS